MENQEKENKDTFAKTPGGGTFLCLEINSELIFIDE
jgi:hypothetical protein